MNTMTTRWSFGFVLTHLVSATANPAATEIELLESLK
jgi:hypothetical protein